MLSYAFFGRLQRPLQLTTAGHGPHQPALQHCHHSLLIAVHAMQCVHSVQSVTYIFKR